MLEGRLNYLSILSIENFYLFWWSKSMHSKWKKKSILEICQAVNKVLCFGGVGFCNVFMVLFWLFKFVSCDFFTIVNKDWFLYLSVCSFPYRDSENYTYKLRIPQNWDPLLASSLPAYPAMIPWFLGSSHVL